MRYIRWPHPRGVQQAVRVREREGEGAAGRLPEHRGAVRGVVARVEIETKT